jgi:hypothetical protein
MVSAAVLSNDWMGHGDRSHPNLMLIDKLKDELTYDGHEKDLREMERCHLRNEPSNHFDILLHLVNETEKMSKGDRSHPNLLRLDELAKKLTYDGWRKDLKNAEKEHLRYRGLYFDYAVNKISRKQKIHDGDRSDTEVKFLDSLHLTYPGWKKHWEQVFDIYLRGYGIDHERFCLTERQRIHDGDRSHPRLVALDSLRLSYPGWEEDVKAYEKRHVSFNSISGFERTPEESSVQIAMFKSKQKKYDVGIEDSSWMHPDQHKIVNTEWTFPGWEKGVQRVRESTSTYFPELEQFQVRQMLHENDYTRHPLLIKLGSIELSYPGWDKDVDNIKRKVVKSCFWKDNFEQKMQGMLNKQRAYNGYLRSLIRDIPGDENGNTNTKESRFEGSAENTGNKECVICWEAPRTHVFVPCGHMCACKSCSKTMIGSTTKCPACNQTATASIEVFFP